MKKHRSLANSLTTGGMKLPLIFCVVLVTSAIANADDTVWTAEMIKELLSEVNSEYSATVPEMVAGNGYTAEVHHVTTEDGYILEMHRIPASPISPAADDKPVVFVMHGIVCSSADWVIMGPEKGLGYILADEGYDVWLGNARGNTYSKNHTTITNFSSEDFWHFSWHEIGYYDLPAMIDFVLETTGQKEVIYIGHSQGTTSFYVMASLRTEYNDKIKVMFSLAPVAYMSNAKSPLVRMASPAVNTLAAIFEMFGVYEFLPSSTALTIAGVLFCNDDAITQVLCTNVLFVLCGFDTSQLNTTTLPVIFGHSPAGSSTRQLVHYGQEVDSGKFRWYDHGFMTNLILYKSLEPPNYDLSLITAPVHLWYSGNDWMSAVEDVAQLYSELGNPIEMVRVNDDTWNHLDYLWGIDAKQLVYDPILITIKESYSD